MTKSKRTFKDRLKDASDTIAAVTVIGAAAVGCGTWGVTQIVAGTNERIDNLALQVSDIELDTVRAQLLTLMSEYPEDESEILKVAEHYFKDLDGDWYMTTLFTKWAEARGIDVSDIVTVKGK